VFADGAGLGDRFVALVGEPESPGWIAAAKLFDTALPAAIAALGSKRGTDSPAVAGVLLFEQYAQRLAAPVLAALHLHDSVVDARLSAVRTKLSDGGLRQLAFARPPDPIGTDRETAHARVAEDLVNGNLYPAAAAVHRSSRVGMRVLHGTVANAIASTFLHMSWPDANRARYVLDAHAFLDRVPGLAQLVTVDAVDSGGERWMYTDRNSCCLAFRTTVNQARDQHYCGTCPVLPHETTRALFGQATASYAERHPRT
jgi:ferric iron reductase protein FhuF